MARPSTAARLRAVTEASPPSEGAVSSAAMQLPTATRLLSMATPLPELPTATARPMPLAEASQVPTATAVAIADSGASRRAAVQEAAPQTATASLARRSRVSSQLSRSGRTGGFQSRRTRRTPGLTLRAVAGLEASTPATASPPRRRPSWPWSACGRSSRTTWRRWRPRPAATRWSWRTSRTCCRRAGIVGDRSQVPRRTRR
mmetsp:Transcript_48359/g.124836  ORF Transcript_48359/g.124836 Transcript_48359/m.124836 type:complete len:202 (-) Transcript_48359:33-638(-)